MNIWLFVRGALALTTPVIAFFLYAGAHSSVTRHRAAPVELSSGYHDGLTLAERADRSFVAAVAQNNNQLLSNMPAAIAQDARRAFQDEPTSATAVRLIALEHMGSQGDLTRMTLLLDAARLNKRDSTTNVMLVSHYATMGQTKPLLTHLNRLLSTDRKSSAVLFPLLIQILDNDQNRTLFADLLRMRPIWFTDFWGSAIVGAKNAQYLPSYRDTAKKAGLAIRPDHDGALLNRLIADQQFEAAMQLHAAIAPAQLLKRKGILRDPEFTGEGRYPPIDWQYWSDGNVSGEALNGALNITAMPGSKGLAAYQLAAIAPGSYRVVMQSAAPIAQTVPLALRLRCAVSNTGVRPQTVPLAVAEGESLPTLRVDGACRYYNVEILLDRTAGAQGYDIQITQLDLLPVN